MIWLVEESLSGNENMLRIGNALVDREYRMYWVSVRDCVRLFDADHLPVSTLVTLDTLLENDVVISYGTHEFVRCIDKYSGGRGKSVSDYIRMDNLTRALGDRMLNADVQVGLLGDMRIKGRVFIRPVANSKWFDGRVLETDELDRFVMQLDDRVHFDDVLISTYKEIEEEYRFFVVGNAVVTGSLYMRDGIRVVSSDVVEDAREFARRVASDLGIGGCYTLDVARVSAGTDSVWKVIECNNFNTSGLYACDEGKIIEEIENYFRGIEDDEDDGGIERGATTCRVGGVGVVLPRRDGTDDGSGRGDAWECVRSRCGT